MAPTEALSPADERAAFRVPAGFEVQLVASEPQIQKPMNLAFDARGRLWVTHSVEYPFAQANAAIARDGLSVLEGLGQTVGPPHQRSLPMVSTFPSECCRCPVEMR